MSMATMTPEPMIARKIGEGYERPNAEQEMPVDINYQKITEYLLARQKLPADWNKRLQAIQAKAAEASQEPGVATALAATAAPGGGGASAADVPMDYFRCVALRDKLAEAGERTLFGGLAGPAATWDKVVKAYEKGFVFVGEASHTLIQNVDYEVPYLRRQAAKLGQQITDAERKQLEYAKNGAACAAAFKEECRKLGIAGVSVRSELAQLVRELPPLLTHLVAALRGPGLDEACRYYGAFADYAHPDSSSSSSPAAAGATAAAQADGSSSAVLLPTLTEVRTGCTAPPPADDAATSSHPDAATGTSGAAAPARSGGAAAASAAAAGPPTISWDLDDMVDSSASALAPHVISWGTAVGDGSATAAAPPAISWDMDEPVAGAGGAGAAAPELCWDIDVSVEDSGFGAAAAEDDGGGGGGQGAVIDWGIGIADEGEGAAGTSPSEADGDAAETQASAAAAGGSSASAADAAAVRRLEHDGEYRTRLLDDLQELSAFLLLRQSELSTSGSELLASVLPEAIQAVDFSAASAMLAAVTAAREAATSERMRQLLLIATSRRYLDRLVSGLDRRAGQEAKLAAAAREAAARRNESKAAIAALGPKISAVLARTRNVKEAVERALSPHLGGRRINILGEINNVLASGA